jgi:hypothetical protein
MTQQYAGRNKLTISGQDAASVPIVSQTEIDPMKTALSLMLALATTTALTEPLPVPKPPGPGGSCPHGYITRGSFCTPSSGAQETIAKPPAHAPCAAADDRVELLASLRALRAGG